MTKLRRSTRAPTAAGIAAGLFAFGAILASQATAGAVGTGGPDPFAMAPAPVKGKTLSSYFQLSLAAGASTTQHIVVSDASRNPETIKLSASEGTTAPNSGVAYKDAFRPCSGTACWVKGIPPTVSLGPGQTKRIAFEVTVPPRTVDSQYLAGITAQPSNAPPPIIVGKRGAATARAIVIDQITVGVAVTVGPLALLRSALSIPGVKATSVGATPRLLVDVRNIGQRFTSAKGSAVCTTAGRSRSFAIYVGTILPSQAANVPVNVVGLAASSLQHCAVSVPVGTTRASWHGTLRISSLKVPREYHIGPGVYATLPPQKFPRWAVYAIAGGGALFIVLVFMLVLMIRRSRKHGHAKTPAGAASTPATVET
ncbi:MAG: WxL protein peptidoglycan domain-containing protein [Acidimicrobiales bacterium]